MDSKFRPNQVPKRPVKPKGHPAVSDLIPLGAKAREGELGGSKLAAAKRDGPTPGTSILAKMPRYGSPRPESPLTKYDELAIDCSPPELYDKLQLESEENDTTDRLICGALKQLRVHRAKPNQTIMLTLIYISKERPSLLTTDMVTGALCNLLKRDMSINFKAKGNPTVSVLACNLLYSAYSKEEHWPQQFIEIYLEDSMGERVWVDRDDCKPFVNNLITAFGTNLNPKNPVIDSLTLGIGGPSSGVSSSPSSSPFHSGSIGEGDDSSQAGSSGLNLVANALVKHRYRLQLNSIENLVKDAVAEQAAKQRPGHIEISNKPFLKLLTNLTGYSHIRAFAISKLELWLQNPKLVRVAQDLLLSVCLNCSAQDPNDKDLIVGLLKMRLKNKQLTTHYVACIRELLEADEENMRVAMTHTIYNELSATKNQNNMQILSVMFQQDHDRAPKLLAQIFIDLLMNKEDYLRALRGLLREIVRTLRHDFTFQAFCASLMENRSVHPVYIGLDQMMKERIVFSITDLVALCELLTISPAVRESASTNTWGDKRKEASVMHTFWAQIASIQRDAVAWMSDSFITMIPGVDGQFFIQCLYKLLMMAPADSYIKIDNWPNEQDRSSMLRLVSETPVLEETIIQIIMMGIENDFPIKSSDALKVVELMVNRAASLQSTNYPVLNINNLEVVQGLFAISTYYHPENIKLPDGYNPPHLAISHHYWQSWLILLIIISYNPSTFGKAIWREYPTLEMLMEMLITNTYTFPPIASADEAETLHSRERQILALEKQEILEFEGHLAAATSNVAITEVNSLLLPKLMSMNVKGPARCPPAKTLEDLQNLNSTLKVGQLLSKSRNPDFLMHIIQRQGTSNAMPWLSDLVDSSEGSMDILPVQCLCEFLLMDSDADEAKSRPNQKLTRHDKLLQRLQSIVNQSAGSISSENDQAAREVIEFFFERLHSNSPSVRSLAIKALRVMFANPITQQAIEMDIDTEEDDFEWLTVTIPDLKLFSSVENLIQESLHKALLVETEVDVISAYLEYLLESRLFRKEPSPSILEISLMLTHRPSVCKLLFSDKDIYQRLVKAFMEFMDDAINRSSAFKWPASEYSVMVQWTEEKVAELDLRIIHASVALLCNKQLRECKKGDELIECWFPASGELPTGFLAEASELAELFTDRLRRDMLLTGENVLLNAALSDLKFQQLFLYLQAFGLPVKSVNLLLEHIDKCCEVENKVVKKAIEARKPYLQQLLKTQRMRGVTTGNSFYSMVGESEEEVDTETMPTRAMKPVTAVRTLSTLECQQVKDMGPDVSQFARKALLDLSACKEGYMVAQRSIVANSASKEKLIKVISEMLTSESKDRLLEGMKESASVAASLFRMLLCDVQKPEVQQLCSLLMSQDNLPTLIKSVVSGAQAKFSKSHKVANGKEAEFNQKMVDLCLKDQHSEALNVCLRALEQIWNSKSDKDMLGLIIDWLELLDPEINSLCSELQDKLLFGRVAANSSNMAGPAYLRSQLTHQTRWSSIRQTIHRLLSASDMSVWSYQSVLDFLSVCVNHPRLYQGRETKKPRRSTGENVLNLTDSQIEKVAQLICLEANEDGGQKVSSCRVALLLQCCVEECQLQTLSQYLEVKSNQASSECHIYRQLLILIYIKCPKVIHWLGDCSILYQDIQTALSGSCPLDTELHAAISVLSHLKPGRKYVNEMYDANLICRKLASLHPMLFLRHLSTLSSILNGRSQYTFGEFVHGNYLNLHTCVLGLMELLQPHVFIHNDFPSVIDAYFNAIKMFGQESDDTMSALVLKFINVLYNFFTCLPDRCIRVINQYKPVLSVLQGDNRYNKNSSLRTLVTTTYMPSAKEKLDSDSGTVRAALLYTPPETVTFTQEQLKSTLRKLGKDSSTEDTLGALSDLDETSKKVVDVLSRCMDEFKHLTFSSNQQIRDLTYKLVKRYVCHNPRVAGDFLTTLISCLEFEDANISKTALTHVADLALLMKEDDRRRLLDSAFYVASLHNSDQGIKSLTDIVRKLQFSAHSRSIKLLEIISSEREFSVAAQLGKSIIVSKSNVGSILKHVMFA